MNRGSEWRIWDLHVHTPLSLENNFNCADDEDGWNTYISALEALPSDIKVIGINDYLFIDGYRKVKAYKDAGRLSNIDLILPVVEFRLAKFCGNQKFKRINYHIIFSNELSADLIQQQFLNALSASYVLSPDCNQTWGGVVTRDNLEDLGRRIIESVPEGERSRFSSPLKEGFNNLNLELAAILRPLEQASQYFEGKYLTAIGKTEWDDFKWDDNSIAEKKTIINSANLVFTASESIEKFYSSKQKLEEQGVNDLLLDCSDAHCFAEQIENKDRLGNCKCWIKAETTFEGLKQILYEPTERVRIQSTKPDEKNIYQVIDSISLAEEGFWSGRILLSPNLNTIIGGRSTGKSSLIKAIAAKHGSQDVDRDDYIMSHLDGVSIRWQDGNDQVGREIEYFKQSYMHDIAFDTQRTNRLVEGIISHRDTTGLMKSFYDNLSDVAKQVTDGVFQLFQLQKERSSIQSKLSESGKREGVAQQLGLLKHSAEELQKNGAMSPEEHTMYDAYVQQIREKSKEIENANNDIILLQKWQGVSPIYPSFEDTMQFSSLLFGLNQVTLSKSFQDLQIRTEKEWSTIVEGIIKSTISAKEKYESEIATITATDTYKKGLRIFQDNKELNDINQRIQEEEKKLSYIDQLNVKLNQIKERQVVLLNNIITKHSSIKQAALTISDTLDITYDRLAIHVNTIFQKEGMKDFLEARFNQRGLERQEYLSNFVRRYDIDNSESTKEILNKLLNNDILLKNGYDSQNVATELLTRSWYSLDYELSYQGDSFKNMSEGKQAFVILKLLLDFSDKTCPILIDQPEDSLDNRAIYNDLVTYIKTKKKLRQIILVTHNSNVVVSADAENVIVANQNGTDSPNNGNCKFEYINGALECTKVKDPSIRNVLNSQGIREHVCDILEGGRDAFEKREQKYGFKR